MKHLPIPRLDKNPALQAGLLKYCRLKPGEIWPDAVGEHRVGCLDATLPPEIETLMGDERATLAIQDPPYNVVAFEQKTVAGYIEWCQSWVDCTYRALAENSALYVWIGADQRHGFQPLPDFMIMMRDTAFKTRSFITMRNQRGYGTQKNWMAVRQELLNYVKGQPAFNVEAEYTEIPKILRGYYKEVKGTLTENFARSHSENIRAGNVWVDIQQVFYRVEENVNGCFAQKPLKSIERIMRASSRQDDLVIDFFAHSGSTLIAAERLGRKCYTADLDPLFCEITIRRLEHFRQTGKTGWQDGNPFESELAADPALQALLAAAQTEQAEIAPLQAAE